MDIIFLNEIKAKTLIGIYPWEREVAQSIQLDLEIAMPSSLACQTDNFEDALDYALIVKRINEALEKIISRYLKRWQSTSPRSS